MFSPTLLRKIKPRRLESRQDVLEGFAPGGPSGRTFRLEDGEHASALLLRPRGDGPVRGTVRFLDEDWNVTLFERSLRVASPSVPDPMDGIRERFERDLRAAIDADETTDATREALAGEAAVLRAAKRNGIGRNS